MLLCRLLDILHWPRSILVFIAYLCLGSEDGWGEAVDGWKETEEDTMVEAKATTQFHVEIRTDKLDVRNWWTSKRVLETL